MSSSNTLKIVDIVGDRIYCGLDELKEFQGALKTLSKEGYEKIKASLLRHDFAAPFFIYKEAGENHILDGHIRLFALLQMKQEGVKMPAKFPCDVIKAKSMKEAKALILNYNSQYGKMSDEGLYEFIFSNDLEYSEIKIETDLPQIDVARFEKKFWDAEEDEKQKEKKQKACPSCGAAI